MRSFNASLRDAETAYLQAVIDSPTRIPTFVELPREWWPDSCLSMAPHAKFLNMIDLTAACYAPWTAILKLVPYGRLSLMIL